MAKKTPKSRNKPEPPKPKINFARQLVERMVHLHNAVIDFQIMVDGSCQYINIEKDEYELCISFDPTGEQITDIVLSKQVRQVVDLKRVWKV